MNVANQDPNDSARRPEHPFRSTVFRGMGVLLPPLLTIVIFLWVGSTINIYVMRPVTSGVRNAIVWGIADVQDDLPGNQPTAAIEGQVYQRLSNDTGVPVEVYRAVVQDPGSGPTPQTGREFYARYAEIRYLQPYVVVPAFLVIFIVLMYLLGNFMAAGIGRFFWGQIEGAIDRLPLVSNVYSPVKQVSDFLFSPREIEYTRVVACEYPRRGIWSLGLVTGESMLDIQSAANEPVLSVLVPTSPMPVTGYTVTIKKSETIDLNITIDQAFQFIISCGVVIPPQQLQKMAADEEAAGTQSA